MGSPSVDPQTIVASFISYYCGVSLCLPVDDCGFIHFILLWGLTLFTSRRLWLHIFHTIVGSHSAYRQTILALYISYYCGVSLCLPVDDCGFIQFILLWGLTLFTSRRLWLHTFHTIVGSHSVYRQTIVASFISYYCGVSLFTSRRLWFHTFHTIVGSHSVYQQTIAASYISYYCGVSLCLPVDDCGFIHFILVWGLTLFTSRRLWLYTFHTILRSHSVYRQTIVASFISYYCGVSLCLSVDDCDFIHFILVWGLPLLTPRRLWLHSFHTIVGSHSVYQQTIVASFISYYCGVSLCLPVDDCGFIHFILVWGLPLLTPRRLWLHHFILLWGLTLFTSRRLWLHSFHTIVGSHSVYQQTIVASYISYYCGVSLCLPVDDCGFIHFILLWGLTLFTQQTIVASYISYYCGVSLCLPVDDCGFIHFILLWGLTLFTSRRLWLHSFHTIVGSHSVYQQTIVASFISYYCGVSLCLPVDDCGFIHFILLWGLTLFTSRRLWLHTFHTIVGSYSVYQQTIVASYISYYCGVSLCLPVDDCGFIHFILLWGLTLFTSRRL